MMWIGGVWRRWIERRRQPVVAPEVVLVDQLFDAYELAHVFLKSFDEFEAVLTTLVSAALTPALAQRMDLLDHVEYLEAQGTLTPKIRERWAACLRVRSHILLGEHDDQPASEEITRSLEDMRQLSNALAVQVGRISNLTTQPNQLLGRELDAHERKPSWPSPPLKHRCPVKDLRRLSFRWVPRGGRVQRSTPNRAQWNTCESWGA
jgi:hypothetical protein